MNPSLVFQSVSHFLCGGQRLMPLFEYVCRECSKQFTFLSGVISDNTEPTCPRCGSSELRKLMSRISRGRSDDERMEAMAERLETKDLDDPGSLRQFAREMGREMSAETGEDMTDEMEAMIEAEARGELDDEAGFGGGSGSGDDGTIY
jgi:putative FmdB family regulatory protein